ncbi:Clp protease ClpP [Aquimarina latercula]|uniref:Clp protease ClpP n=1 Tax=Aquimarina latercula TaxID=987 RepID=UPI000411753F|nr:Clp protease ClpP [Aquimarina latercula]
MVLTIENNNIYLYGYIWDGDGAYFLEQFALLDGSYPILDVHLHCYGGAVFDGNMIYNTLINATSQVDTNVIGVGASMGAVLAQAGTVRRQVSNGFQMIHAASGYTYGTYQDHLSNANLLKEVGKNFTRMLVSKTGKTASEVSKWLVGDNWFSAEQALEAGLIDEIIDPQATLDIEIDDPKAVGSHEIYNRFAASMKITDTNPKGIPVKTPRAAAPQPTQKSIQKSKPIYTMEQSSITLLGLQNVTPESSETMVVQAIQARFTALENKYNTEKAAKENVEAALNAIKEGKIKALLDAAQGAGKFTAKQRDSYEAIGKDSGLETLETVLEGLQGRTSLAATIVPGTTSTPTANASRSGWNWDKYQSEDPRALEAKKTNDLDTFKALFKAKFGVDYTE